MASGRPDEEEDPLAEEIPIDEEEEEGEDLFGDNMAADYVADPELDNYDPEMLDEAQHAPMTLDQRLAAEQALRARDRREGRRRRPLEPQTPGGSTVPPSSPFDGSDTEYAFGLEGSQRRKRRRRGAMTDAATPQRPSTEGEPEEDEEDVRPSQYDLSNETLREGASIDARLEQKIRTNFRQFLQKFSQEGQEEPRYPDLLRRMAEDNQRHLEVRFDHLQRWSPPLALWLSEHPVEILPLLNETLMEEAEKRFGTYKLLRQKEENELRVAVHQFPITEQVRELCTKHLNKVVKVNGVVTKRNGVFNQVKRLYLRCAKCNFPSGPFDVQEDKGFKPGSCIECQSKGPWKVDRQSTLYRNFQKITLQESPSSVDPGKMPRSKEVILTGDQVDSVRPGDEVQLTGIFRCHYDAGTNARTCFPVYRTEIEAIHLQVKGDVKLNEITDDQQQHILELSRSPGVRERLITSMAPSIYGMWHVKTAIALSMMGGQPKTTSGKMRIRGDINTLLVGDPGLAKSQFLKYIEQTVPRAVYTTGKGASAVGLTAAVTRDEHGQFCLEGGAMVLADNGMCLIDEFDKMNDQDRTSLHEAMEQQSISISKAGIVATLKARCAVVAVANPIEGRYNPQQTFSENVNLSDPILSRFDILCVLRDEADSIQDERLAEHVVCSHCRSHPDADAVDKARKPKAMQQVSAVQPIDQELLRKYIAYAKKRVHPKIAELDKEKLANFYKDIRASAFNSGGAPMTARHVDSIIRMAEASARLELREHVTARDLDIAIGVMLESFIQSQKHQVAEELRQKFRRYIAQATPVADQIMALLEKMFKNREDQLRFTRPSAEIEASEVGVTMQDIVQQLERLNINLDDAHAFMRTAKFQQNYRPEGDNVYRVV